jgi:hypothetical protein
MPIDGWMDARRRLAGRLPATFSSSVARSWYVTFCLPAGKAHISDRLTALLPQCINAFASTCLGNNRGRCFGTSSERTSCAPPGSRGASRPLWQPTDRAWRWNIGFAALYTSLDLRLALAERLTVGLTSPIRLVVGLTEATIGRVLDLTIPDTLARLGITHDDLTADDYSVTQLSPGVSVRRVWPRCSSRLRSSRSLVSTLGSASSATSTPPFTALRSSAQIS